MRGGLFILLLSGAPAGEAMARHRHIRIDIPGLASQPHRRQRMTRGVQHQPLVGSPATAVAAAGFGGVALAAAVLGTGISAQAKRWLRRSMPRRDREKLVTDYAISDRSPPPLG